MLSIPRGHLQQPSGCAVGHRAASASHWAEIHPQLVVMVFLRQVQGRKGGLEIGFV